ncbi:MAG: flavin reductase family protein [Desulfobacteraceae bacterium]|nr:MAG: flavin reductase family protein [Desulfobacteraceae bacterium]
MTKNDIFEKQSWKPGNVLSPVPVVLVSCGGVSDWKPNIITIAWTGSVCSDPPMLSISVRPERYSYDIIKNSEEFVVNVPSRSQVRAVDWCGMVSGRNVDKFEGAGLTPSESLKVQCPVIRECPINIECRVRDSMHLGTHTMFVAEVVAVQIISSLIDAKGRFRLEKAGLLAYGLGQYFSLGAVVGRFGCSVQKRKRKPRR